MEGQDRISVGLVSDTHGYCDPYLREAFAGCAAIVHAGDIGRATVLEELEEIAPVYAVKGNIDGADLRFLPLGRVDEFGPIRVATLHIAGDPRRPKRAALELLGTERPQVFVAGHTHVWVVGRVGGALWINPGAAGIEGHHDLRSAAILHIGAGGELSLDRVNLGPRGSTASR